MLKKSHPLVKHERVTLYQRAHIGGQTGMFDFCQDVFWLRTAAATTLLFHGQRLIKRVATYVDVREYLGCVETALMSYAQLCDEFLIDGQSTLEVVVSLNIEDVPHIEARSPGQKSELVRLNQPWYRRDFDESDSPPRLSLLEPAQWVHRKHILSSLEHFKDKDGAEYKMQTILAAERNDSAIVEHAALTLP